MVRLGKWCVCDEYRLRQLLKEVGMSPTSRKGELEMGEERGELANPLVGLLIRQN